MLRNLLAATLLLFVLDANAYEELPKEFRGIKWGADIKTLSHMKLMSTHGAMRVYIRTGDKMQIGAAEISDIEYTFYRGRFYQVYIVARGFANYSALKDVLDETYGRGEQPNRHIERYSWGLNNRAGVAMQLDYNEFSGISGKAVLFYNFTPISEEQDRDEKKTAKGGAKDL